MPPLQNYSPTNNWLESSAAAVNSVALAGALGRAATLTVSGMNTFQNNQRLLSLVKVVDHQKFFGTLNVLGAFSGACIVAEVAQKVVAEQSIDSLNSQEFFAAGSGLCSVLTLVHPAFGLGSMVCDLAGAATHEGADGLMGYLVTNFVLMGLLGLSADNYRAIGAMGEKGVLALSHLNLPETNLSLNEFSAASMIGKAGLLFMLSGFYSMAEASTGSGVPPPALVEFLTGLGLIYRLKREVLNLGGLDLREVDLSILFKNYSRPVNVTNAQLPSNPDHWPESFKGWRLNGNQAVNIIIYGRSLAGAVLMDGLYPLITVIDSWGEDFRVKNSDLIRAFKEYFEPVRHTRRMSGFQAASRAAAGRSLRRAVLNGVTLEGEAFCNADLRKAELREADLSNVNLRFAKVEHADMRGAYLPENPEHLPRCFFGTLLLADQVEVLLKNGVSLNGVIVSDSIFTLDLTDFDLSQATFQKVDFSKVNLPANPNHWPKTFRTCRLNAAQAIKIAAAVRSLEGCNLGGVAYYRWLNSGDRPSGFSGFADFTSAVLDGAQLMDAVLTGAVFINASLKGADLSGANLESAMLQGACVDGANFKGANLQYANLDTDLSQADLRNANLLYAKLPSDPKYWPRSFMGCVIYFKTVEYMMGKGHPLDGIKIWGTSNYDELGTG